MRLLLFFILILFSFSTFSQEKDSLSNKIYMLELEDESEHIGEIISEDPDKVTIKKMNGQVVNIPSYKIVKKTEVDKSRWDAENQEYVFPNLHRSRYFFSPTAIPLKQGEGYYANIWWLYWTAHFGVSDYFSAGIGTSFIGMTTLAAKFTIPNPNESDFNSAFGWFWVGNPLFEENTFINMPFYVATFGSEDQNLSFAMGYNLRGINDNLAGSENRLVMNMGGVNRIGRKSAFIFELWTFGFDGEQAILGGPGIRWFRKQRKNRFGIGPRNSYAGASVIDFQILFERNVLDLGDGEFSIIPVIGASTKF